MATKREELSKHTPFEQWVIDEGLKVIQQQLIPDIRTVDLEPWERTGCNAALLDLVPSAAKEGSRLVNQGTTRYVCDIPPGGTYRAERHMYEEMFYVVSGRGATTVWYEGSPKHTFEWQEESVFCIPLNAWHELYNGSGDEPVRLYAAFNAPTVFNLYASSEFIFNSPATFLERFDPDDETYFSGSRSVQYGTRLLQTNFIPSVRSLGLERWEERGPGSNMMVMMANGHFLCHLSEFPPGTYKKAHTADRSRTRAGLTSEVAYLFLSGEGYDLQWPGGVEPGPGVPWERLDYGVGSLLTPGTGFHQHFNASDEAIRYVVLRFGSPQYMGRGGGGMPRQIEFEDEDPAIREHFEEEVRRRGLTSDMGAYTG